MPQHPHPTWRRRAARLPRWRVRLGRQLQYLAEPLSGITPARSRRPKPPPAKMVGELEDLLAQIAHVDAPDWLPSILALPGLGGRVVTADNHARAAMRGTQ